MSKQSNEIENEIGKLIDINKDACEFYESAQTKVGDVTLQRTFRELEGLHQGVMMNLQNHVRVAGETHKPSQTFGGQTRQAWSELLLAVSNDVDETLVSQLEEAEDRCLHSMEDVMSQKDLPMETKMLLQGEIKSLRKSHDHMKSLKKTMKAA